MKSTINLPKDGTPATIQVFPLSQGKVNITTGSFTDVRIIHCVVDGDVILTWTDDTTDTISCVAGGDFATTYAKSLEVSSGTFHLA